MLEAPLVTIEIEHLFCTKNLLVWRLLFWAAVVSGCPGARVARAGLGCWSAVGEISRRSVARRWAGILSNSPTAIQG